MTINFPPIQKSVVSTKDDLASPFNFITIKNGTAVILGAQFIFCFDIRGYFQGSQLIKETEMEEFEELMTFLEGKKLLPEFWEKMVGKHEVRVLNEECINITSEKTNIDLYYEENQDFKQADFDNYLMMMKGKYRTPNNVAYGFSPRPDVLNTFLKGFSGLIKKSQFVFKQKADLSFHPFTVDNMPYVFGLVTSDSNVINKEFQFDLYSKFVSQI